MLYYNCMCIRICILFVLYSILYPREYRSTIWERVRASYLKYPPVASPAPPASEGLCYICFVLFLQRQHAFCHLVLHLSTFLLFCVSLPVFDVQSFDGTSLFVCQLLSTLLTGWILFFLHVSAVSAAAEAAVAAAAVATHLLFTGCYIQRTGKFALITIGGHKNEAQFPNGTVSYCP
ncbi:hypothetical protein T492DRAFT_154880 [Pavlovales sp. CCMP2436]|nr:hypothetical protein T492DRAFT_154880 [Pavlovales sp. CCMP2436]